MWEIWWFGDMVLYLIFIVFVYNLQDCRKIENLIFGVGKDFKKKLMLYKIVYKCIYFQQLRFLKFDKFKKQMC